jgi:hypothetical protein
MKVDQRRSQTLIKKNKNKNTIKKPAKTYISRGEGGEAHWPACGGQDGTILR